MSHQRCSISHRTVMEESREWINSTRDAKLELFPSQITVEIQQEHECTTNKDRIVDLKQANFIVQAYLTLTFLLIVRRGCSNPLL